MHEFDAFRIHRDAGGFRAGLEKVRVAAPAAGEVLIAVEYSGVNYKDALAGAGAAKITRTSPLTGGIDLAGVVAESASPAPAPGTAVLVNGCGLSETRDGGYAPYALVPADVVVPIPAPLDTRAAMIIGTAGFTAALAIECMRKNGQAPANGPVLVTGASGGVGSFAVHLLAKLGFEVVAATRKPDAHDYLRKLGAARVIGAPESAPEGASQDKPEGATRIIGTPKSAPEGAPRALATAKWGGAIENLGGAALAATLAATRPWGNVASIGLAQSQALPLTVMPFIIRGVSLLGITSANCPMAWKKRIWKLLAGEMRPTCLDEVLADTLTLQDLPHCFRRLLAGQVQGRQLIRCR